jgi:hypothetical protein
MKKVTTTFYLNGRIKVFNGDSESDNLSQFLDQYSEDFLNCNFKSKELI